MPRCRSEPLLQSIMKLCFEVTVCACLMMTPDSICRAFDKLDTHVDLVWGNPASSVGDSLSQLQRNRTMASARRRSTCPQRWVRISIALSPTGSRASQLSKRPHQYSMSLQSEAWYVAEWWMAAMGCIFPSMELWARAWR
jgi:hypothetical protein